MAKTRYRDLFLAFFKVGLFTFGGGYAMLPLLQREIVKRKWATIDEIYDYYAIGQVTPGIIAVNVSTFIGYKTKGIGGAVVSMIGIVLPSFLIICSIATGLSFFWKNHWVQSAFNGIRLIVPALIIPICFKMIKKSLVDKMTFLILGAALLLFISKLFSPAIIALLFGCFGMLYKGAKK